jgi:hypothetical protein
MFMKANCRHPAAVREVRAASAIEGLARQAAVNPMGRASAPPNQTAREAKANVTSTRVAHA